jgi:hypothetical protein
MRRSFVLIAAALVAIGCGASSEGPDYPQEGHMYSQTPTGPAANCPMAIRSTDLEVIDLDDGVALEFEAHGDHDVVDLRNRTRNLASLHYQNASGKPGQPIYGVAVRNVEGGARIELRPSNPHDIGAIQRQARADRDIMLTGFCDGLALR